MAAARFANKRSFCDDAPKDCDMGASSITPAAGSWTEKAWGSAPVLATSARPAPVCTANLDINSL